MTAGVEVTIKESGGREVTVKILDSNAPPEDSFEMRNIADDAAESVLEKL